MWRFEKHDYVGQRDAERRNRMARRELAVWQEATYLCTTRC